MTFSTVQPKEEREEKAKPQHEKLKKKIVTKFAYSFVFVEMEENLFVATYIIMVSFIVQWSTRDCVVIDATTKTKSRRKKNAKIVHASNVHSTGHCLWAAYSKRFANEKNQIYLYTHDYNIQYFAFACVSSEEKNMRKIDQLNIFLLFFIPLNITYSFWMQSICTLVFCWKRILFIFHIQYWATCNNVITYLFVKKKSSRALSHYIWKIKYPIFKLE